MNSPDEKTYQNSLINFFTNNLNYEYKRDFDLFEKKLRTTKKDYLLKPILEDSLQNINNQKSKKQIQEAIFELEKITNTNLTTANKKFNNLIKNGIDTFNDDKKCYEKVFLFDFENPQNNHFLIVDEFKFTQEKNKRCDLVVFINGLPISVIELKNPFDQDSTIDKAFNQIKNYQNDIKDLFITNCFNCISNLNHNLVGTITSSFGRYTEFKDESGNQSFENHFQGLYSKQNLIKIIRDYIIFTTDDVKIIAAYHQFFCVEKLIAKSINPPTLENYKHYEAIKNQIGVVWHTTGSGKSLTMTFYVKQLLQTIKPLIIVLTDRIDLDYQLFNTFAKSKNYLGLEQGLKKIQSRYDLISNLKQNKKSEVIFTTIQKFLKDENKFKFDELSTRDDIFIIVDEAHRSQYDLKDGLARHLRDALPNAKFIAFSGTPIELESKNTKLIFGDYIDKYVMSRGIKDKVIVPIHYEPRLAKIGLKKEQVVKIDKKVEKLFDKHNVEKEEDKDFLKMEAIISDENRLKKVADDFLNHYQKRQSILDGKAMFCAISRKTAIKFYNTLEKTKPEWFSNDDNKGKVKVVISGSSADEEIFQKHIRTKEQLKQIEKRFKDDNDDLKIVIVVDMWLTGFDVPCLNTLYIDKPLKAHNLIQAISRVNRVYSNKESGLVVDYIGIGEFLKTALKNFSNEDKQEITIDFEKIITEMMNRYELTKSYFNNFDYSKFFETIDKKQKLELIKAGVNHIIKDDIKDEKNKKNYLLNSLKLLKAYSLCPLSNEAKSIVDEINYFNLVRNTILNITQSSKKITHKINLENELSKLLSQAIEPKGIIDIYYLMGINKPDISILSEEFLQQIKNMKYKNLAYELMKKLLADEIKLKTKGNIVLQELFSKKLQKLVKQYQNQTIESAKVIDEIINIAKDLNKKINENKKHNLSKDEVPFYQAVAQINNKEQLMKEEALKDLAKELVSEIRKNKTIDWDLREQTRAKMRRMIKKLLKEYNYPPKKIEGAKEDVLKQAKVFCESID